MTPEREGNSNATRLGLALSGGGFRASFFHIGVLARMAETGLLRQVEVLSTVSGGSIVGALYYVWLKALLENAPDAAVTDAVLAAMVERIREQFLDGVQCNIRCLALASVAKNLRMASPNYSISDRLGELYDEVFYRPALARFALFARERLGIAVDPTALARSFGLSRDRLMELRNLKILPLGEKTFHPRLHNQGRQAKVPVLQLNATCLNTGHNWRFEAARMGEPELRDPVSLGLDKHWRLLRPDSYAELQKDYQDMELGFAVAASACVPGLFTPLALGTLYPEGLVVQLVDGGVHDNQGVEALRQNGCTHLVLSDASGQMNDESAPAVNRFHAVLRSKSILEDRLRQTQLHDALQDYGENAACMHLKSGLPIREWYWRSKADRQGAPGAQLPGQPCPVAPEVQDLLSRIRTDLDSFSDIEANALMADGYLLSRDALAQASGLAGLMAPVEPPAPPGTWGFLAISPWMAKPSSLFRKHLAVASSQAFKVFLLDWKRALIAFPLLTALLLAVALVLLRWIFFQPESPLLAMSLGSLVKAVLGTLLAVLGVAASTTLRALLKKVLVKGGLAVLRLASDVLTALAFKVHLRTYDRLFLRLGQLTSLGPPPP